jgi:hypothetical protein
LKSTNLDLIEAIAEVEKLTDARERDHYLCVAAGRAIDRKNLRMQSSSPRELAMPTCANH